MKEGWVRIYSNPVLLQTKLAEDVLKQVGIESHIVNKPDSVLPVGDAELYTPKKNVEEAIRVLTERGMIQ